MIRQVMTSQTRLPEPLKATYPVPKFPELRVPSKDEFNQALKWLSGKQVVTKILSYEDIVSDKFLP